MEPLPPHEPAACPSPQEHIQASGGPGRRSVKVTSNSFLCVLVPGLKRIPLVEQKKPM